MIKNKVIKKLKQDEVIKELLNYINQENEDGIIELINKLSSEIINYFDSISSQDYYNSNSEEVELTELEYYRDFVFSIYSYCQDFDKSSTILEVMLDLLNLLQKVYDTYVNYWINTHISEDDCRINLYNSILKLLSNVSLLNKWAYNHGNEVDKLRGFNRLK